ncbi:MAG: hypothetical protein FJW20_25815 [Acidimicrobiia bacterium]|nr:hypothetical protein [Acidimicrobiia bacterium]
MMLLALALLLTPAASTLQWNIEALKRFFNHRSVTPANLKVNPVEKRGQVGVYDYAFDGPLGGRVPGLLTLPAGTGAFPLILYGHWMMKGSPLRNKSEFLEEAIIMSRAGAACLLLDTPLVREGFVEDPEPMNGQNEFAQLKMAQEWRRALDLLSDRADIDMRRIAYVGHSFGAGHELNAEARLDRARWLRERLELDPLDETALSSIPPLR